MKVLLVNPPWYCLQNLAPNSMPLGLCYLAAVLREHGHECAVYDGDLGFGDPAKRQQIFSDHKYYHEMAQSHPAWDQARSFIADFAPDICGITFTTGAYDSARRMVDIVKEVNPRITVVLGGVHPTLMPDETLREMPADVVVKGEGEETLLAVVERLGTGGSLDDVAGVSFRRSKGDLKHNPARPFVADLDALPFPARDLIIGNDRYEHVSVLTSRGCPFRCTFCASHKIWGRKVRFRSPKNIISEIEQIRADFGNTLIRFFDDTFTLNERRIVGLCELLSEQVPGTRWVCYARVDVMTETMLCAMKEAGCVGVFIGVESGNENVLSSTKKGITVRQIIDGFALARRVGVPASAYFMVGFPGETVDQVEDSIRLMKKIRAGGFCAWSIATPYPGTAFYEAAESMNLLAERPDWADFFHHSETINMSNIPDEQFRRLIERIEKAIRRLQTMNLCRRFARKGYKAPILLYGRWMERRSRRLRTGAVSES